MTSPQILMSHWTARQRRTNIDAVPTPETVRAAVNQLNGADVNDLYIYPDGTLPEIYMAIGGGKDDHYFVFITEYNAVFTQAVSPSAPDGEAELTIGRRADSYALKDLIGLDAAIEAATHYLATGRPAPELTWAQL
ncbi:MAG: hypothetical protein GY946_18955 [bacterium]|nr:hypothetical protein [bacterium]